MTLSEELTWRGFVNQTTFKDLTVLDGQPITFYWGVDPSSDSLQIGNLAAGMMVKAFVKHGHKPVLLVGGATGLIGDPDGKAEERTLKSIEEVARNKAAIAAQYRQIFGTKDLHIVDNYDWFKDIHYLEFLRDVGKHVPMRQMLGREFVQTRLGEDGAGISYAEFSYVLIQAYDFLHMYKNLGVTLQVCGSDQWGNSVAGVDLIRRKTGGEANVYSVPLVINKATGKKFGKSEDGAVWLDPAKTSPYQFYQFWLNVDDEGVEDYLKIFTELDKPAIDRIMSQFNVNRATRSAQRRLAEEVTRLVHGEESLDRAERISELLISGVKNIDVLSKDDVEEIKVNIPHTKGRPGDEIVDKLVELRLASSKTEARRFLQENSISINGVKVPANVLTLSESDFVGHINTAGGPRLALIKRGKAFKDSALIELV